MRYAYEHGRFAIAVKHREKFVFPGRKPLTSVTGEWCRRVVDWATASSGLMPGYTPYDFRKLAFRDETDKSFGAGARLLQHEQDSRVGQHHYAGDFRSRSTNRVPEEAITASGTKVATGHKREPASCLIIDEHPDT